MDALLTEPSSNFLNELKIDCASISMCQSRNLVNGYKSKRRFLDPVNDPSSPPSSSTTPEVESPDDTDSSTSNSILKYISEMLMEEEDLEEKTCMLQECLALQAAAKPFHDILNPKNPDLDDSQFRVESCSFQNTEKPHHLLCPSSSGTTETLQAPWIDVPSGAAEVSGSSGIREKKTHGREEEEDDDGEYPSNKQTTLNIEEETEQLDLFDEVLLCQGGKEANCSLYDDRINIEVAAKLPQIGGHGKGKGSSSGRRSGGRRKKSKEEVVDLWTLLTQCAQAVASNDHRSSIELLKQIRQHSSPHGNGNQRMAHYFGNGLEARLAGTETPSYLALGGSGTSAAQILKSYQVYVQACPFKRMSNFFANRTIMKKMAAEKAKRVHLIDFGILYGFQWPCLIQRISNLPGGPPKLRITGIELPQSGFRPAERVEETGRRLLKYCKRFGVEAEYQPIAKKWETIGLDDLRIDPDELTVVNCLYRLRNLPDESVVMNSPRERVLKLIRDINPDIFMFGAINGTYSAPFFLTRFREALFHFSSMFDMFDACVKDRENEQRRMFEKEVFGRDAMNVIACEGVARVERPETYKQWQVRNTRAGFKQAGLDEEIFRKVKRIVRSEYHKDYVIDQDGQWMLQGWKGRVIYALSCWLPAAHTRV